MSNYSKPRKRLVRISDEQWKKVKVYAAIHDLLMKDAPENILIKFFNSKEYINNVIKEEEC